MNNASLRRPPLDADFFNLLRASGMATNNSDAQRLLTFVEAEFGTFDLSMEAFYSQVFLHDRFVGDVPSGRRGKIQRYRNNLIYFQRVLLRLFDLSLRDQVCDYHESLVRSASATDTFISFNYDCLLDRTMQKAGRRWEPRRGYGFEITRGSDNWADHTGRGPMPSPGIRLLKPHGSLNWQRDGRRVVLRDEPYSDRTNDEPMIVPPLWQKDFDLPPYRDIWTACRAVLKRTKALILIGYSLPLTDVYTQALLRIDVQKLDFLCIVNPDQGARDRIKLVLRSALHPSTHLIEMDYLKDLATVLNSRRQTAPREHNATTEIPLP